MYSTAIIHALGKENAMTLEDDPQWIDILKPVVIGRLKLSNDIVADAFVQSLTKWDVVFIDCYSQKDRLDCAEYFLDRACIVAHDTEAAYWRPFMKKAKYKRHFDFIAPMTSWLSNVVKM